VIYFDTSFLTPLLRGEETSAAVERFIAAQPPGSLATGLLTKVEFASVLSRDVRVGSLTAAIARQLNDAFAGTVASVFVLLPPSPADFDLAYEFVRDHLTGLRAPDALHLAMAANNRAEAIYTLDKGMVRAGKRLRLPVKHGIRFSD